jgi:hypothetical protein
MSKQKCKRKCINLGKTYTITKKMYENKVVNYILPAKTLTFLKLAQK